MDKRKWEFCRQVAVQQWKNNFPLWISGAFAGAILVFVAVCWAFQEKGIHAALILCCTGIALFIVGKKSVCPDRVSIEQMEVVGATPCRSRESSAGRWRGCIWRRFRSERWEAC